MGCIAICLKIMESVYVMDITYVTYVMNISLFPYYVYIFKVGAGERNSALDSKITQPDGGLVLWIQVSHLNGNRLKESASEENLDIRVGSVFTESNRYSDCVRINIGYRLQQDIEALLDKLVFLIKKFSDVQSWVA